MSVYFLHDAAGGFVKIGFTAGEVSARVKDLQVASAHELVLFGSIDGDESIEFELHERFKAHRVRGEWFRASPEVLAAITLMLPCTCGTCDPCLERLWMNIEIVKLRKARVLGKHERPDFDAILGLLAGVQP